MLKKTYYFVHYHAKLIEIGRTVLWRGAQGFILCKKPPISLCFTNTSENILFLLMKNRALKSSVWKTKNMNSYLYLSILSICLSLMHALRFFRYCFTFSFVKVETLEAMSQKGVMQLWKNMVYYSNSSLEPKSKLTEVTRKISCWISVSMDSWFLLV